MASAIAAQRQGWEERSRHPSATDKPGTRLGPPWPGAYERTPLRPSRPERWRWRPPRLSPGRRSHLGAAPHACMPEARARREVQRVAWYIVCRPDPTGVMSKPLQRLHPAIAPKPPLDLPRSPPCRFLPQGAPGAVRVAASAAAAQRRRPAVGSRHPSAPSQQETRLGPPPPRAYQRTPTHPNRPEHWQRRPPSFPRDDGRARLPSRQPTTSAHLQPTPIRLAAQVSYLPRHPELRPWYRPTVARANCMARLPPR